MKMMGEEEEERRGASFLYLEVCWRFRAVAI